MMTFMWIVLFILLLGFLAYQRASLIVSSVAFLIYLLLVSKFSHLGALGLTILWLVFLVPLVILNIPFIRRQLISAHALKLFKKVKPPMSATEKEALGVGTVGWEGELFSGRPNWKLMLDYPAPQLTAEELAFINGPVEELCRMLDNWSITQKYRALPPKVWQFLKDNRFFSFIIPKKYGGLHFSAYAHAVIISKLSGRSITAATVVGVPNSLGPAELLLEYGTEEQKNYYLPRLAKGEEIPCFALTSPEAGSDATAMTDYGIVAKGQFEGKEVLGIRLFWNKRYITLAPVATLLGLAFKLYDPDRLLGGKEDLGITCALIPTHTPGVKIGRRHFPAFSAFPNGPTQGHGVFIPMDWIIGGQKNIGRGWMMLIERLSIGRAISLPSTVLGGSKVAAYTSGAYARIRKQFNLPIGYFEGVNEVLTRILAKAYMTQALRNFAVSAIDRGEAPAVPSAIAKFHATELGRIVINDAMDVHGGKGICLGPHNYLAQPYAETPVAITVEGANILTRNMIIFGQGAIRCHPYVLSEMLAAEETDTRKAVKAFDKALFGHIGFVISNKIRAFILGLTHAWVSCSPVKDKTRRCYQKIERYSAAFAFLADMAMATYGGQLKRKEKISARLGDILSYLYMACAVLKQFRDEGSPESDLPLIQWNCETLFHWIESRMDEILSNFPNRFMAILIRFVIFPLGRHAHQPSHHLGKKVADLILSPTETRDRVCKYAYLTPDENNPVGKINIVLQKVIAIEELDKKLYAAERAGKIKGKDTRELITAAEKVGIITKEESAKLLDAYEARLSVIAVDDFDPSELEFVKY